ncbi:SpvB/TcaC N-terminal domain-containing protein [Fodinibius roseus]|nr:SpvB/TcaC N-terminal domain-containing protein [Fodinibius roseus]
MNHPSDITFAAKDLQDLEVAHQINVNPSSGVATIAVDIPLTSGRSGFTPDLSLTYHSNKSNSAFGAGWELSGLPAVSLSLKEGFPEYSGGEKCQFDGNELVPFLNDDTGGREPVSFETAGYKIHLYRSGKEQRFLRFEKWVHKETKRVHWRMRDSENIASVFGLQSDGSTRISDPQDETRTFRWLLEAQYDPYGNAITYEYKKENRERVNREAIFEKNRSQMAQRYLKRISYGNTIPLSPGEPEADDREWLFEVLFDYGEHASDAASSYEPTGSWLSRPDPYSVHTPGFEVRTYRLCRRVLMFHHFPEELGEDATLVGSVDFAHHEQEAGTTLESLSYTGYRRNSESGVYREKSVPPLQFDYTQPESADHFQAVQVQTTENAPVGIGSLNYKWIDLYGEGLPGILFESNQAWYYKRNLGDGRLGKQRSVAEKPSATFGSYSLSDFNVDGNMNLAVLKGREAGFYEYERDTGRWSAHKTFIGTTRGEQFTRLIDLTGDGRPDLVHMEQDRIVWYPSRGREGFGAPRTIAKPASGSESELPTLGADPGLNYFFADMTGDGLPDQVRITNGSIEYWPNKGRGRFGRGVVMGDAPYLECSSEFDGRRIRLVDLDGSGTADLLYIGRGEVRYWINANGNRFLDQKTIGGLPYIDQLSSVQVIDFLGNGTPCLVWSSGTPRHAEFPIRYLPLTSGVKPGLLIGAQNSMGKETQLSYGYSAEHYLRDRQNGRDWISRLPSHRTVVDRLEVVDHIGNTRFEQRFEYHDGFYDGEERAFQGFGVVDRYDSETHRERSDMDIPEAEFTDPVCIRTWFHSGLPGWEKQRSEQYYQGDGEVRRQVGHEMENTAQLSAEEYFKLFQALAGRLVRTEVYGLGREGERRTHPFQVSQHRFLLRRIQPGYREYDPCVASFPRESLNYQYEEASGDPRIEHSLNLEIDSYGQVRSSATVAYPRRMGTLDEQVRYQIRLERRRIRSYDEDERYALGIPLQQETFELHGITPGEGASYFDMGSLQRGINEALDREIPFHTSFTGGPQSRLVRWNKTYYWDNDRTGVLPWAATGSPVLVHHREEACFDTGFLTDALDERYSADMAADEGAYENHDGYWWKSGPTFFYREPEAFYLPERKEHLQGGSSGYTFDEPYFLTPVSITDALDNRISAEIDYHLLAPDRITDYNDNVSEVRYDPLGMIELATSYGDILSREDTIEQYGHESLENYTDPSSISFEEIVDAPETFVQGAGGLFFYELGSWTRRRKPLRSVALDREQWVHDGEGNRQPESEVQVTINYLDGFGRSLQTKTLAESGDAIARDEEGAVLTDRGEPVLHPSDTRWRVSGHTVYNNKQKVVRQFEPFFSSGYDYEPDDILEQFGYSNLTHYDAMGREIRTDYPDGSRGRVEISPWEVRQYDPNDTVLGSLYEMRVEAEAGEGDPEMEALEKARQHRETPVISHLDPLGRPFMTEEQNGDGTLRRMRTEMDYAGNPVRVVDPRTLEAFTYSRDMLGRVFYERSMDAGEKRQFIDALDRPLHQWDGREVHQQIRYDSLDRITRVNVDGARGMDHATERYRYGEHPAIADARLKNLRGRMTEQYDSAGVLRVGRCDLTGQVLDRSRQLTEDYKDIPDWTTIDAVSLQEEGYVTRLQYDALARTREEQLPEGSLRRYRYNQSGAIARVEVSTADGAVSEQPVLRDAAYNANGQRIQAILGNGVIQTFHYDDRTKRLGRLTAHRPSVGDEEGRQYQNIRYTYDPAGNITHLIDTARPNGASILAEPRSCSYTYDAFYQLIRAEGRTHRALETGDYNHDPETEGFRKGTRHIGLNNAEVIRNYTREYHYDLGGNLESMIHITNLDSGANRWRRDYRISERSNRSLPAEEMSGLPVSDPESRFDGNGNTLYLPHLSRIEWDYRNQLSRAVIVEREGRPDDVEYYGYGADNQRVRKVHERVTDVASGTTEITEKIYLDGCEIKRVRSGDSELLKRYTVHLTDGAQRLGLMHRWERDTFNRETDDPDTVKFHYQLTDRLGSAAMELNEGGELISYEEYFPYGGSAFIAGSQADVNLKEYRYSGKEQDDATRLYYFGYRYYAPWIGNWLSPDPIGPGDSLNLYQYVRNNPVNLVDQNGLYPFGVDSNIYQRRSEEGRLISGFSLSITSDGEELFSFHGEIEGTVPELLEALPEFVEIREFGFIPIRELAREDLRRRTREMLESRDDSTGEEAPEASSERDTEEEATSGETEATAPEPSGEPASPTGGESGGNPSEETGSAEEEDTAITIDIEGETREPDQPPEEILETLPDRLGQLEVNETLVLNMNVEASVHAGVGGSVSLGVGAQITRTADDPDAYQIQLEVKAGGALGVGEEAQGEGAAADAGIRLRGRTTLDFAGEQAAGDILEMMERFSEVESEEDLQETMEHLFPHISRARGDVGLTIEPELPVVSLMAGISGGGEYRVIEGQPHVGQTLSVVGTAGAEPPAYLDIPGVSPGGLQGLLPVPDVLESFAGQYGFPRLNVGGETSISGYVPLPAAFEYQMGNISAEELAETATIEIASQGSIEIGRTKFVGTYTIRLTNLRELADDLEVSLNELLQNLEAGELTMRDWEELLSEMSPEYRNNFSAELKIEQQVFNGIRLRAPGVTTTGGVRRSIEIYRGSFAEPWEAFQAWRQFNRGTLLPSR